MKLEPAKCPSCGANIEVNKDLEKTICQYCGTTVLIKDAIQKYKIELTGSVQVDGLKSDKKKFEEVENYFKLKEYDNAKNNLEQIIANDEFNVEANCKWIYAVIKLFNITEDDFKNKDIIGEKPEAWQYIKQILTKIERLATIDEDNERNIYLQDLYSLIDVMKKYMQEEKNTENKRKELAENLSKAMLKKYGLKSYHYEFGVSDEDEKVNQVLSILKECFDNNDILEAIEYKAPGAKEDIYEVTFNIDMYRYGFFIMYRLAKFAFESDSRNPRTYWKYYKINKEISSMEDLEKCVNDCIMRLSKPTNSSNKKGLFHFFK